MKKSLACAFGVAVLLAGAVAFAQDTKAPGSGGKTATPTMAMMPQMDEHMKKMQALHEKMMSAATPEERQKAMEVARKEMQESMTMMKPMMQGGAMMGEKGKSTDSSAQMQMMGKRMDMMQMMMQMMMDQQGMMGMEKSSAPAQKK